MSVVRQPVPIRHMRRTLLVSLFESVDIPPHNNVIGPQGGLDLSGFRDYRLVLRLTGAHGALFTINELYGPAGDIDQLNHDIDTGSIGMFGSLNYRRCFEVFGPKSFFIRICNNSAYPMRASGSLYAVR